MTSSHFLSLLDQYLAKFREAAQVLAKARQLSEPTEAAEAQLLQYLTAYTWMVRSRALLLTADCAREPQPAAELHTRLSVVEALVALRCGRLPESQPAPDNEPPALPALWQRLIAAESRLFHLYGVASLN